MNTLKITAWLCAIALSVLGAVAYLQYSARHPSTDDAYVQAHVGDIAARVSGQVLNVYVKNQQYVKKGQALFQLDPQPFKIATEEAQAKLELAKKHAHRIDILNKKKLSSQAEYDKANSDLQVAQATLDEATLNLKYTTITSPANGYLAHFNLRVGDAVQALRPLFYLVENNRWWVVANFKETQLVHIKEGQPAEIKVDMYPDHTFKGVVESISRGSGSEFSLLPPENATGNWVKVTQRFPVKITILKTDPKLPFRIGASCMVTVNTEK